MKTRKEKYLENIITHFTLLILPMISIGTTVIFPGTPGKEVNMEKGDMEKGDRQKYTDAGLPEYRNNFLPHF